MTRIAWSDFHARVHRRLRVRSQIPAGASLLVALSGGQDSICLLKILVDLQSRWQWQLQAAHCDHRWRSDSADNARFVEHLCQDWGIPCQVVTASTAPATEAEARRWRYQVLEKMALEAGYTHLATGHTASDRAETLLYNLIRGSGADGLQALAWERPLSERSPTITVVRPLLAFTRQDTARFCQQFKIPVWDDATNQDTRYARNRLRLEVIPQLKTHFNPNVETSLAQTAELLTADVDLLNQLARTLYDTVVHPPTPTTPWRIQRSALKTAHLALQRRVMRQWLQQVVPAQVSFEAVEKLVALIHAPNRSQTDPFAGGQVALVEGDWIVFSKVRSKG